MNYQYYSPNIRGHRTRILISLNLILLSLLSTGQDLFVPKVHLEVQVLLYKNQELMDLTAIVKRKQNGKVDELSFYDWLYYEKDGKKEFYPEAQIDHMEFTDFDGKHRLFVSSRYTDIKNARGLWEIMFSGRITWFREYYPDIVNGTRTTGTRDFFVKKGEQPVQGRRLKKTLLELTIDQPELASRIKSIMNDGDILAILRDYK